MSDLNKPKSGKNPQLPSILQQIEINGKHSLSYSDVQFRGPVPCLPFWFKAKSHTPQSMPEYVRVPRQPNPVSAYLYIQVIQDNAVYEPWKLDTGFLGIT